MHFYCFGFLFYFIFIKGLQLILLQYLFYSKFDLDSLPDNIWTEIWNISNNCTFTTFYDSKEVHLVTKFVLSLITPLNYVRMALLVTNSSCDSAVAS